MSFAVVGIGTAAVGLGQTVLGGIRAGKANRAMENTPTPYYQPDKGIMDYYSEALNRYNTNPFSSQMYQVAKNNANRSLATGIGALQDRRAAVGKVGALVSQNNIALQNAGVQAELQRNRDFASLGQAANMEAGDKRLQFQYNRLLPYQKRMSILGAKAQAGAQMENAGLQNLTGGIMGAAANGLFSGTGSSGPLTRDTYNPGLANTSGTVGSPAASTPYIGPANSVMYMDPNSYSTY